MSYLQAITINKGTSVGKSEDVSVLTRAIEAAEQEGKRVTGVRCLLYQVAAPSNRGSFRWGSRHTGRESPEKSLVLISKS